MTRKQRAIIQHALGIGVTQAENPYRKHFIAGPYAHDFNDCERLVAMGYMTSLGDCDDLYGGNHYFVVTEAGARAVGSCLPND